MSVSNGIGEGVGKRFADAEGLHGRQVVVQRIGIGTIGAEGKGSVGAGCTALGKEGNGIVDIRVRWGRQGSRCGDLRIFGDGGGSGCNGRCVVGSVNGDGERVGSRCAVVVRDGVGEGVGKRFPHAEPLDRGRGVVQRIGIGAVGIQRQGPVGSGRAVLGKEGNAVVRVHVQRCGQCARGGGLGVFRHGSDGGGNGRRVVGAVDGHGERIGADSAVAVRDGIGEGVGERFPGAERLHGVQVVVQRVGVGAVGPQGQGTVVPQRAVLGYEGDGIPPVGIAGRWQGSGGCELCVLSDGGCRCGDGRRVVGAVDGNSQGVGGGSPVVVAHRVGERFGQAVSRSKGAHGVQVVVEVVGPCAVRMQRKGAVGPRRTVLGQEGHHVVRVRIMGRGQYAADAARDACGPGA